MAIRNIGLILIGLLAIAGQAPAHAATTTYDFTTSGFGVAYELVDSTTVPGLTLTVTGANATYGAAYVTTNSDYGLGVLTRYWGWYTEQQGPPPWGQSSVDGRYGSETITFDFSETVLLSAAVINNVGLYSGVFDVIVDGLVVAENLSSFVGSFTGSSFGFRADGWNDFLKIQSISVSSIPVPAGLPLLAGALGLLGFVGRSRGRR